jgi:hypothetical protein
MINDELLVKDFFTRYPEAKKCYLVAGQLFHENAEESAKLRGAFYGQKVETFENPELAVALEVKKPVKKPVFTKGSSTSKIEVADVKAVTDNPEANEQ